MEISHNKNWWSWRKIEQIKQKKKTTTKTSFQFLNIQIEIKELKIIHI